jgi:hypothetical protein
MTPSFTLSFTHPTSSSQTIPKKEHLSPLHAPISPIFKYNPPSWRQTNQTVLSLRMQQEIGVIPPGVVGFSHPFVTLRKKKEEEVFQGSDDLRTNLFIFE